MTQAGWSELAEQQADRLYRGADVELHNAVMDAVDLIFEVTSEARRLSATITTHEGAVRRLAVAGHPPWKVYWTADGPLVRAIIEYPT